MENKLKARWSKKEKCIIVDYPLGIQTKCDCNYLLCLFTDEFEKEMKDRGYNLETLKFEITVDKNSSRYAEKFPTLSKEDCTMKGFGEVEGHDCEKCKNYSTCDESYKDYPGYCSGYEDKLNDKDKQEGPGD